MHNSKTSGKSYIGYTYKTIEARWEEHCHSTNKHHFQHAIAKYGKDDWTHTILEEGDHITPNKQEVT